MTTLPELRTIADIEFANIVSFSEISGGKLRLHLRNESFIDIWHSRKIAGRYALHWERSHIDGSVYRHDNIPDKRWKAVSTFPKHFHDGSEESIRESTLSDDPRETLRQFLTFASKMSGKANEEETI